MTRDPRISRRVFLTKAGSMTLALGASQFWRPRVSYAQEPYGRGIWVAGDHHIHTKYSPDGQYEIVQQVGAAFDHGLSWCVITDHGGPTHDKVAVEKAYPELLVARKKYPGMIVFQGMEWNVPEAEHGSVILPPTPDEAKIIAEFESIYDELNISRKDTPANTEADAVAGVKYLQSLKPQPLFFANHPARRGRNSPHEMRNWSDAGPDVAHGFEGSPGHQAASLVGFPRGHYEKAPKKDSWEKYPLESYRTWCGYDWYVAKVGGLWDSLLGEGRPWFITSNSDSHRHYTDHTKVDGNTYLLHGHVTPTTQKVEKSDNIDFWPGEYNKTWVYTAAMEPMAILQALRTGSMFTVHGDLIDRLELSATSEDASAPMGGTLILDKAGQSVTIRIRVRVPDRPNFGGRSLKMNHVDVIVGDIIGPSLDRDSIENPTTRIVQRFEVKDVKAAGGWMTFTHAMINVRKPFYVRLRGTNRDLADPVLDSPKINPWDDLWFYSNPVMIRLRG